VLKYGLRTTLDHIRMTGNFPVWYNDWIVIATMGIFSHNTSLTPAIKNLHYQKSKTDIKKENTRRLYKQ
jgi:hypothetical protein